MAVLKKVGINYYLQNIEIESNIYFKIVNY